MAGVSEQIEKLKKEHGAQNVTHVIFKDGKQVLLSKPSRKVVSLARAKSAQDSMNGLDVILANCWLAGDEEIKDSVGHLLFLDTQINKLVGLVEGEIKN